MSLGLDISVTTPEGEEVELNWLRNPFGLCNWAEDNVHPKVKRGLWYVCNHWSYKKSSRVNRPLFKGGVLAYWREIKELKQGYFVFDLPSYRQFIEPNISHLPTEPPNPFSSVCRIKGSKYTDDKRLMVPMEHFDSLAFHLSVPRLGSYQDWFKRLVYAAELLQRPDTKFYCSN